MPDPRQRSMYAPEPWTERALQRLEAISATFLTRANKWFFVNVALGICVLLVPYSAGAYLALHHSAMDLVAVHEERHAAALMRPIVEMPAALVAYRDALLVAPRDAQALRAQDVTRCLHAALTVQSGADRATRRAWQHVAQEWAALRKHPNSAGANQLLSLANRASMLTLSSSEVLNDSDRPVRILAGIQVDDMPMLRDQLYAMTMRLREHNQLSFHQRVSEAVDVNQVAETLENISGYYVVVGRLRYQILDPTHNNAQGIHRAIDPLIALIREIVENQDTGNAAGAESRQLLTLLVHADSELNVLLDRTADEMDFLLIEHYNSQLQQQWITRCTCLFVLFVIILILQGMSENLRQRADDMDRREALERERAADQLARKTAEQALAATAAFRQIVMDCAPLGIATIDTYGTIIDWNPYLKEFIGDKNADIIGEYRDEFIDFIRGKDASLQFERNFVQRNGTQRWADIVISKIYDDSRHITVCMLRDITEKKDVELRLNYEATHDGLTKLANRNLFRSTLGEMIPEALAASESFAVLFIDLDLFKSVNDTYGHAAGDCVLITVASRLQDLVGEHDLVARFGGDEFAILVAAPTQLPQVEALSQAIVASLAEPIVWEEHNVNIGSSIGLTLGPSATETAEELMRNADTAMYAAKQMGRGRYVVFDPEMQKNAHHSVQLANDLHTALQEQTQLYTLYQPIIELATNRIYGFEACVRWRHAVLGEIDPDELMRIAEQSGAIRTIGRYMLRQACQEMTGLYAKIPVAARLRLCAKIAQSELAAPNFVESTIDVLRATDFDPSNLYLEISERNLQEKSEQATRILARLQEFGIHLSMNDFGAGYSSLRHLQDLQLSSLKVNHRFIDAGVDDESERALLRAVVQLAAGFQLPVVAEGIQSPVELELVRSVGCQYAQGVLWAKPMTIAEVAASLLPRSSKAT